MSVQVHHYFHAHYGSKAPWAQMAYDRTAIETKKDAQMVSSEVVRATIFRLGDRTQTPVEPPKETPHVEPKVKKVTSTKKFRSEVMRGLVREFQKQHHIVPK